jgi:peptide/nickel transport system permease protein
MTENVPTRAGFWRRYARNPGAVIGLFIIVVLIGIALAAPMLYPVSPWKMVQRPFVVPFTNPRVPLGTDTLGRNVIVGLVHGARVSLLIGVVSTGVSLAIGVPLGAIAGYFGGLIDDIAMRVTEFFQTVPSFALAIVLVAILQPSLTSIILAIAIVGWPPVARLVRGEVMAQRQRAYVEAATLSGQGHATIILRQILPNVVSPVIVLASLMIATAILLESSLSFLGLGDPSAMSWGYMIGAARTVVRQAWWLSVMPGAAIVVTVLALNLIGDGLSEALDPRSSRDGGR